jgi:hypothetical protein
MLTADQVKPLVNSTVRIEFADGLVVTAMILDVQDDQDHDQVAYKLLDILRPGSATRPRLTTGDFYTSDLQEMEAVQFQ